LSVSPLQTAGEKLSLCNLALLALNWLSRRFLGPRMIYTSGVINDITRKETLEELQDNKLALVCHKLELKPTDTLLDIGCGWGTLTAYAAKNFGCDATGITLGKNQTIFGNKRIEENGVPSGKARILCKDYRDIGTDKKFSKIVSLEMAEVRWFVRGKKPGADEVILTKQHVGIRNYNSFLRQVYNLLEDDGILVFQVAGFRPTWQYEDLIWCVACLNLSSALAATDCDLSPCFKGSLHEQIRLPRSRRFVRAQLGHWPSRARWLRDQVGRRYRCSLCVVFLESSAQPSSFVLSAGRFRAALILITCARRLGDSPALVRELDQ
jgi:hypothetical protein